MPMDDAALLSQITHLEQQAVSAHRSEVAAEQRRALDYYNSEPFGNEEDGRSRVISSDVWDVVEGLTPLVLKPFVSADEVVRFNALGADDEEAAEQESDYINWVVTQRNDAFSTLTAWVKAGLLQKNGIVKYWWETSQQPTVERYYGVPDDLFALILQDPEVQVVEHTETVGPDGLPMHDVMLRTVEEIGTARYCVIPHEEFRISAEADTPSPQDARFVQHVRRVTIGELRAMGYEVEDDLSDGGEDPTISDQLRFERDSYDEGADASMREVLYKETFLRIDYDGDGLPELRKVCSVGSVVLANEETEEIPFVAWTPYQQAHKFWGRCPADEATEIQLIKSTLWRQTLDNIYTINNNRVFAGEGVNLDDLIDNQIAGVVRVTGGIPVSQAVMPAPITPIGAVVQPMIEYLDAAKENRTGFTRYNQGMDANSLNKTATGVRLITQAGANRVDLMARAFAEQGLSRLMRGIHGLCRRHATKAETIRLRGKWVNIDPRGWKRRADLSVSVGLGTSDQQMKLAGLQMLMAEQKQLSQVPGLVQPKNLFNAAAKLAEAIGFKNPEQFFSQPEDGGQDPRVQHAMQAAQQQIQALQQQVQQLQSGAAVKQMEIQGRLAETQMKLAAESQNAAREDDLKRDLAELAGVVQLLAKRVAPPQALAAEVGEDLAEEGQEPVNEVSDGQA